MTGRAPGSGSPRRDPWRGDRRDAHRTVGPPQPARSSVEVEELPAQRVLARSRARVPLTGGLAVGALALLLAAGFGFLGGRTGAPIAPPLSSQAARVSSPASAASDATAPAEPMVTPWVPCGEPDRDVPGAYLQVDGNPHFGQVEVHDRGQGPDVDVFPDSPGDALDRVVIPMDGVAEIWMSDGRCANEWYISMKSDEDPVPIVLESVSNKGLDPAIASQNRFDIFVAPNAGRFDLRAIFSLADVSVRATWRIDVPELAAPGVNLEAGGRAVPTELGCGAVQRLANGAEVLLNPCFGDMGNRPSGVTEVGPGEELAFAIDGWAPTGMTVRCGQIADLRFLPREEPPCSPGGVIRNGGLAFAAPEEPGTWALMISACASPIRFVFSGSGELCGTWYASIRVRG